MWAALASATFAFSATLRFCRPVDGLPHVSATSVLRLVVASDTPSRAAVGRAYFMPIFFVRCAVAHALNYVGRGQPLSGGVSKCLIGSIA